MMKLLDFTLVAILLFLGVMSIPPRANASAGRSVVEAVLGCLVILAAVRYAVFVWGQ